MRSWGSSLLALWRHLRLTRAMLAVARRAAADFILEVERQRERQSFFNRATSTLLRDVQFRLEGMTGVIESVPRRAERALLDMDRAWHLVLDRLEEENRALLARTYNVPYDAHIQQYFGYRQSTDARRARRRVEKAAARRALKELYKGARYERTKALPN